MKKINGPMLKKILKLLQTIKSSVQKKAYIYTT